MICENVLCIYYSNKNCLLDEVSLDVDGRCCECIYISIDEKTMEKAREKGRRSREEFESYFV